MPREPIPTYCFALVVVRGGERFLLVQEAKHGREWYLPAGRVEPGETFVSAALRETLEEGGIPIRIVGILRVEHSPRLAAARMRVIFLAEPVDETPPKSEADDESLQARWVTLDELSSYRLRGDEVADVLRYVAEGGEVYPVSLLQGEGNPFVIPPRG